MTAVEAPVASVPSRRLRGVPIGLVVGGVIVGLVVAAALLSYAWTPFDPIAVDASVRLQGPFSGAHLLGTDALGRDLFSQILIGSRTALYVGVIAVSLALVVGVPMGGMAAAGGRIPSELVLRWADIMYAFPAVLMAIMLAAALGPSTTTAMIAIGIAYIPVFARVTRGAALQVLGRDFVAAARGYGRGRVYIFVRHVLPNIASILIVQATISFALAILAEAALSYLGLGTQPPQPSWGRMLRDAQTFLTVAPNLAVWPGLAIALSVIGFNLVGDGIRDLLDPTLRKLTAGP